jgi:hypothetical protein
MSPSPTKTPKSTKNSCCNDNVKFQFKLDIGHFQDCAWLTKRKSKTDKRKTKYCKRDNVAAACISTCDNCRRKAKNGRSEKSSKSKKSKKRRNVISLANNEKDVKAKESASSGGTLVDMSFWKKE